MHCEHGLFFYNCTPRLSYKILHGSTENDSSLLLPFRPPLLCSPTRHSAEEHNKVQMPTRLFSLESSEAIPEATLLDYLSNFIPGQVEDIFPTRGHLSAAESSSSQTKYFMHLKTHSAGIMLLNKAPDGLLGINNEITVVVKAYGQATEGI